MHIIHFNYPSSFQRITLQKWLYDIEKEALPCKFYELITILLWEGNCSAPPYYRLHHTVSSVPQPHHEHFVFWWNITCYLDKNCLNKYNFNFILGRYILEFYIWPQFLAHCIVWVLHSNYLLIYQFYVFCNYYWTLTQTTK